MTEKYFVSRFRWLAPPAAPRPFRLPPAAAATALGARPEPRPPLQPIQLLPAAAARGLHNGHAGGRRGPRGNGGRGRDVEHGHVQEERLQVRSEWGPGPIKHQRSLIDVRSFIIILFPLQRVVASSCLKRSKLRCYSFHWIESSSDLLLRYQLSTTT